MITKMTGYENLEKNISFLMKKHKKFLDKEPRSGIYFPDGWLPLVDEAIKELSEINEEIVKSGEEKIVIAQIKEKFGRLVIYMEKYPDKWYERILSAIDKQAERSISTCEITGKKGESYRVHGWLRVLSEDCGIPDKEKVKTDNFFKFKVSNSNVEGN